MPLLGAHMPIKKGDPSTALEAGAAIGCEVVQLFVKSPMQWFAPPFSDAVIGNFVAMRERASIALVAAHAAYLINLASPRPDVLLQSRKAILEEMQRCHLLGIRYLVVHTGAHLGFGERRGLQRLRESLHWLFDRLPPLPFPVTLLLENTGGQGTCLGYSLEQLASVVEGFPKEQVAVCLDTCHLFVAGYEMRTPESVDQLAKSIDATMGWDRVKLLHANDSLYPLGSRIDRHWHIGEGEIGWEGFRCLLSHPLFAALPIVIETPDAEQCHAENLRRLRSLLTHSQAPTQG